MSEKIEFEHLVYSLANQRRLFNLVRELDKEYTPSISSQVSDLHSYVKKMITNAIVVIAKNNEEDIGFIATYCNDEKRRIAYITSISVKKEFRSKNIGKKLVDIAIADSLKQKMESIELEVNLENTIALNFYNKYGFKTKSKAGNKSIIMQKKLFSYKRM